MAWFWYFLFYSFLGFLVEVVYVRLRREPKRDRKCGLLLPVCPVYGLGALAILLLPETVRQQPLLLFPAAALACTGVEYGAGLFYQRVFRVSFWDYSHLPMNLGGRVCPLFSLFWGGLAVVTLWVIHPWVTLLVSAIPPWALPPVLLLRGADPLLTALVLRRTGDTNALRWYLPPARRRTA